MPPLTMRVVDAQRSCFDEVLDPRPKVGPALPGTAYGGGVAVTGQESVMFLRARTSAAFADLQVILMRNLAIQLKTTGAPDEHLLRVEAAADQLEAAAREAWRGL